MVLQLSPSLPVIVVENPSAIPAGSGLAIFLSDDGLESHTVWAVAYDDGGAIFWVPNPFIRLQANPTAGRNLGRA
jgi:hypothetical protein